MQSLTPELKRAIYNILKENGYISTLIENGGLMDILSELWDVYSLPATGNDLRYKDFGRELHKHYVLNSDWTDDEVFIAHLRLLETEDTKFIRFVKDILNNNQVKSPLPTKIVEVMQLLGEGGYMVTFETVDGYTVFTIEINADLLNETEANDICFFVTVAKKDSRSDRFSGHDAPDRFPSFMLVHNPKWNDYSCWSWFSLFYYPDADHGTFIGNVKIIKRGVDDTMKFIPKEFYTLPDAFCSLGLSTDYYTALHDVFDHDAWRVAKALRDCACFSEIEEAFANDVNFRYSLRRENSSEKALREGRFLLAGYDMGGCYSFKYKYLPGYAEKFDDLVGIDFNFKYECQTFERIIGLIGENGVGKTSLLRQITDDLSHKRHSAFDGSLPFYSKIIVVSYSPFDHFAKPHEHAEFRYKYCGLMKNDHELLTAEEQISQLMENLNLIHTRKLQGKFIELLSIIIEDRHVALLTDWFDKLDSDDYKNNPVPLKEEFHEQLRVMFSIMSSGQLNYLLATAAIVANIRYDALLLFDEPEQHLHPNAITQLIRGISSLLESFCSYAIIATHSPLIVRELVSDNVYVMTRENKFLSVAKIPIECFGEDIAILNDVIFSNRDQVKRFEEFIRKFVSDGKSYEDILKLIETDNIPLGLSAKLLIKRTISQLCNRS